MLTNHVYACDASCSPRRSGVRTGGARRLLAGMLSRFAAAEARDGAPAGSSVRTFGSGGSQLSSRSVVRGSAAAASTFISHSHAQPARVLARSLAVGLPDRLAALQAQRANLVRYVAANQAEFDRMPFHPWTSAGRSAPLARTRLAASSLPGCVGLQGVILQTDQPARSQEYQLLLYPGVIMTEELFVQFTKEYHCPTALELPALSLHPANKDRLKMLIVGDPTSHGAIINDGVKSGHAGRRAAAAVTDVQRAAAVPHDCVYACCLQPTALFAPLFRIVS